MSQSNPSDVVQYVVTPALRPHLDAYLTALGFEVQPYPFQSEDDLPTFVVVPGESRMRAARDGQPVPSLAVPRLPSASVPASLPVFTSVDERCQDCSHPTFQHLGVANIVRCSMCPCTTQSRPS